MEGLSSQDQALIGQMAQAAQNQVADTYDVLGHQNTGHQNISVDQSLVKQADAARVGSYTHSHPLSEAVYAKNMGIVPHAVKPKGLVGRFKDNVGSVWMAWMAGLLGTGQKVFENNHIKGLDPKNMQMKGGFFSKSTLYNLFPSLTNGVSSSESGAKIVRGVLGDVAVEATDPLTRNTKWMTRQLSKAKWYNKIYLKPLSWIGNGGEWLTNKLYGLSDYADKIAKNIKGTDLYKKAGSQLGKIGEKAVKIGGKTRSIETVARYGRRLATKAGNTRVIGLGKDVARQLGYTGKLGKAALIITGVFALLRGAKNLIFGTGGDHPYYGSQSAPNMDFQYYDA